MLDLTREKPIRIEDVTASFGVSQTVVESWLSRGLEHVKIGGKVFTSREAVTRFCGPAPAKEAPPPPPPNESPGDGARALLDQIFGGRTPKGSRPR